MNSQQRRLQRRESARTGLEPKFARGAILFQAIADEREAELSAADVFSRQCVKLTCTSMETSSLAMTLDDHVVTVCAEHEGGACQARWPISEIDPSKYALALDMLDRKGPEENVSEFFFLNRPVSKVRTLGRLKCGFREVNLCDQDATSLVLNSASIVFPLCEFHGPRNSVWMGGDAQFIDLHEVHPTKVLAAIRMIEQGRRPTSRESDESEFDHLGQESRTWPGKP